MAVKHLLRIIVTFSFSCAAGRAQEAASRFGSAVSAEDGRALFQIHCAYCHGSRGEGGRGADLTTGQYRRGGTDENLYNTVRNGIPGTEMPAVKATDEEVWKMVAFVRRIGAGVAREKAAGDPAAGKLLFEGKGGCAACHAIGAEGGSLGPDLTNVARRRGLKAIEEAITTSVADGGSRYRAIQVVTSGGEQVSGIRLNEDDLSIQVRDDKGNLRSFLKQNLREVRRDVPPLMPSYGGILSGKEIGDLVAYLNSVGGVQ